MKRLLPLPILAVALLLALPAPPPAVGFQGVMVDTCGNGGCHGPAAEAVNVTIDGPSVLEVNQRAEYRLTVVGGPARRFGFYVALFDETNRSKDVFNRDLFLAEPRSFINGTTTNVFAVNVTAPRYATMLTIKAAAVSADNDSGPAGDVWNVGFKVVEVRLPPRGISADALVLAVSTLGVSALVFASFHIIRRRFRGG